jgi:hypothetical protein
LLGAASYYLTLGELLYEWNDLEAAEQFLSEGVAMVTGTVTYYAAAVTVGYFALARLQQAKGMYMRPK